MTVLFAATVGGLLASWARLAERVASPDGRWAGVGHGLLLALPLGAFVAWVPSSWIVLRWDQLDAFRRVAAVANAVAAALVAMTLVWLAVRWWRARRVGARSLRVEMIAVPLALGFAALGFWADAELYPGLYADFHVGLAGVFLLALSVATGMSFWLCARRRNTDAATGFRRIGRFACPLSLVLLVGLELGEPPIFGHSRSLVFSKLTAFGRSLTDFDGDEFSNVLGGSDCAPFDDEIGPRAFDVPGNGRDEDCSTSDLRWPPAVPACGGSTRSAKRHNVVVLTIDSLRADRLSSYGHERQTSRRLDALAGTGLRYTRAYAQATHTLDSLPSLFTGLYPSNVPRDYDVPGAREETYEVGPGVPLLAELLRAHGYDTLGLSAFKLPGKIGLPRGFHVYETNNKPTRRATKYLREAKEPFFLWVHYQYPHEPYKRHAAWDFGDEDIDRYDSEVAFSDREVGRVLDVLDETGLAERTMVVVTADHGEEFGEHGGYFHGGRPYRELVHVPLVIKVPGGPRGVVDDVVELIDIAPTIADVVGLPVDCGAFDGRSLLDEQARRADPAGWAYAENLSPEGVSSRALFTGRWRIVEDLELDRLELYDTRADPDEQNDLAAEHDDIARGLYEALSAHPLRAFSGLLAPNDPPDTLSLVRALDRMHRPPLVEFALARLEKRRLPPDAKPYLDRLLGRPELGAGIAKRVRSLRKAVGSR